MMPWLAAFIYLYSAAGSLAMDRQDLVVGMKLLPLLSNKITGNVKVAIVYDPAQPASQQEAESVKSMIEGGLDLPGEINASAVLVPANDAQKMAGSRVAIVTPNLKAYYPGISAAADAGGILTISTDLDCAYENHCVIGVVSKPHIQIYYSRTAAESAKISFESAFTILAKPASLIADGTR